MVIPLLLNRDSIRDQVYVQGYHHLSSLFNKQYEYLLTSNLQECLPKFIIMIQKIDLKAQLIPVADQ